MQTETVAKGRALGPERKPLTAFKVDATPVLERRNVQPPDRSQLPIAAASGRAET